MDVAEYKKRIIDILQNVEDEKIVRKIYTFVKYFVS